MRAIAFLHAMPSSVVLASCQTATTGKETILRTLPAGEIFAAPALLGDGITATVTAECDSQILTVERDALLEAIRQTPEIALRMLMVFNSRLQPMTQCMDWFLSERSCFGPVNSVFCISTWN